MSVDTYLKYYWLETGYLEEIRTNFYNRHFLTPEEFFAIIIWKRNASKTLIKKKLLNGQPISELPKIIEKITNDIYCAKNNEQRLEILLDCRGINISFASAILTILYPEDFTVYDYRVRGEQEDISHKTKEEKIRIYLDQYVPFVKKENPHLSLRDSDRALWAKSWYEDLQHFIKT